jgi:hypothetical protein
MYALIDIPDNKDSQWKVYYTISDPLAFDTTNVFALSYLWSESGPTEVGDITKSSAGDDIKVEYTLEYGSNNYTWYTKRTGYINMVPGSIARFKSNEVVSPCINANMWVRLVEIDDISKNEISNQNILSCY